MCLWLVAIRAGVSEWWPAAVAEGSQDISNPPLASWLLWYAQRMLRVQTLSAVRLSVASTVTCPGCSAACAQTIVCAHCLR